jgi:HD-like signal output (HDOD) protein
VLRVVNSSLFGLSHSVGDLNEAVSLLGMKQLKLLVLGFSLPEQLFLGIAGEQLDWYWNSTLARAVAAREVSEQLFKRSGDEAFLAGLLQDLGVLVLLRELGGPYAALVSEAIGYRAELSALEQTALGFDHVQLTAGLLVHWKMPQTLVRAIAEPRSAKRLAKSREEHAHVARVTPCRAARGWCYRLTCCLIWKGRDCDLMDRSNDLVSSLEPRCDNWARCCRSTPRGPMATPILMREATSRVAESIGACSRSGRS